MNNKRIWTLLKAVSLVVLSAFACTACGEVPFSGSGTSSPLSHTEDPILERIVVDTISQDAYYAFLTAPSVDLLLQGTRSSYRMADSNTVRYESAGHVEQDYSSDSCYIGFLGNVKVSPSLIAFLNHKAELQQWLSGQGVTGDAQVVATIFTYEFPLTVWITIAQENWFITINEDRVSPSAEEYDYCLYSQEAYQTRFCRKELAVQLDGIPLACHGFLHNQTPELPAVAILSAIGAQIQFTDESKSIANVVYQGKTYLLDSTLQTRGETSLLRVMMGGTTICHASDGDIWVGYDLLLYALQKLNPAFQLQMNDDALNIVSAG